MNLVFALLMGTIFGTVLVKSEVASWFRIQKMFRFEEAHMFLIIGSAVAVGVLSIVLIKKLGLRTLAGEEVSDTDREGKDSSLTWSRSKVVSFSS